MSSLNWALAALDNPKPRKSRGPFEHESAKREAFIDAVLVPAPIVVPVPVVPQVAAVALWDDLTAATALLNANGHSVVETPAAKDPAAMLASALEIVKAAGFRVTKPKARVKDRVGPTFVAIFADGEVTRMSTFTSLAKLDIGRGIRLSQAAYASRMKLESPYYPPIRQAHFEQDGAVLASFTSEQLAVMS